MSDLGVLSIFCGVIWLICIHRAKVKERKEAELLERNPEAWRQQKEFEEEKKYRKRRAAGDMASTIATLFFKK